MIFTKLQENFTQNQSSSLCSVNHFSCIFSIQWRMLICFGCKAYFSFFCISSYHQHVLDTRNYLEIWWIRKWVMFINLFVLENKDIKSGWNISKTKRNKLHSRESDLLFNHFSFVNCRPSLVAIQSDELGVSQWPPKVFFITFSFKII